MRFFFNLAGAVYDPDNKGFDLRNLGEARKQAVKSLAQSMLDEPEMVWLGEEVRMEVTNRDRQVLFTVIAVGVDGQPAG
jgi:hypothetical protein